MSLVTLDSATSDVRSNADFMLSPQKSQVKVEAEVKYSRCIMLDSCFESEVAVPVRARMIPSSLSRMAFPMDFFQGFFLLTLGRFPFRIRLSRN